MPLKLRLKPGEKAVINGAVITAGDNGATFVLHNQASLLREKDIIQEHEADTPAKRIYFTIMLMYLDPGQKDQYMEPFNKFMIDLMKATTLPQIKKSLLYIHTDVTTGDYYRALKTCRAVIQVESELLKLAHNADEPALDQTGDHTQ